MHAIRLHAFGPAANLTYEEVPDPTPGPGQVRIEVEASGVHFIETTLRRGNGIGPHDPPPLPHSPGAEAAGIVAEVGPGVDAEWLGRRVVAELAADGGYAEQAIAAADDLHPVPDHLDAATAVAMITTGATTQGLLHAARLTASDVVLVMSAAGGVGSLLVQEARRAGATVVGVAGGPAKVRHVRELGADVAVDYRDTDWPDQVHRALRALAAAPHGGTHGDIVTVVLDGVGGTAGRAALELLGPGGRFLLHGWASGTPTALTTEDLVARGLTAIWALGPAMLPPGGHRELQSRALHRAATAGLTPLLSRFPLAKAADAHAALESRGAMGKVVLLPRG
ncbi:zinc-binding dehydrogenase [Streptomyces sp. NPDC021093]|uniref:zinc-binding dehydrogenase n=1 Tax=Streptomyces sp. NPDC021093 TaxID=3365112 RepID=UPI0037AFAC2A